MHEPMGGVGAPSEKGTTTLVPHHQINFAGHYEVLQMRFQKPILGRIVCIEFSFDR